MTPHFSLTSHFKWIHVLFRTHFSHLTHLFCEGVSAGSIRGSKPWLLLCKKISDNRTSHHRNAQGRRLNCYAVISYIISYIKAYSLHNQRQQINFGECVIWFEKPPSPLPPPPPPFPPKKCNCQQALPKPFIAETRDGSALLTCLFLLFFFQETVINTWGYREKYITVMYIIHIYIAR